MTRFAKRPALSALCIGGLLIPGVALPFSPHAVHVGQHTTYSPVQSRAVQPPARPLRAPGHVVSLRSPASMARAHALHPAAPAFKTPAAKGKR